MYIVHLSSVTAFLVKDAESWYCEHRTETYRVKINFYKIAAGYWNKLLN